MEKIRTKTKQYLKIIGIESMMMVITIINADIACLILFVGRIHVDSYSNFMFGGNAYQYNLLTYIVGIALYLGLFVSLYKKIMKKSVIQLAAYSIPLRVLAWCICLFWALVMFITLLMVVFLKIGLSDNMEPEIMTWISIIGWPVVTVLFIGINLIRKILKNKNKPL